MVSLVRLALRQRLTILGFFIAMVVAGGIAFYNLNIEAYPDPVPPMVEIVTQGSGLSAEEMERGVTVPIEVQMSGLPHMTAIRAISLFGLSDVKIQFTYDFNYDQAQQQVINRLAQLPQLPGGAIPTISPTSPVGEIYRYRIKAPAGYSVEDLKTLQDWVLQRRFRAIPGVIDVTGWGGKLRSYDIVVDRDKLAAHHATVGQVISALAHANANVGGQTINFGAQSAIVRGVGLIQSVDQIQNTLVSRDAAVPVLLRDVAEVKIGNMPRNGIAGLNKDDDVVEGIVLMRRGAQSMPTIQAVKAEIDKINSSGVLPPGVSLERIYDRSDLIGVTTHTVMENLVAGVLLIFFLQWAFLGNLRSALIVAATIPFALAFAVLILTLQGESANLLSVGALDFGLVVDATVIMVENIFRHMSERSHHVETHDGAHYTFANRLSAVLAASSEVSRGIFFAAAIIIASFLPLFTLTGVEGHIFGPMAKTYAYAIIGGLIATFTVAPVLSAMLLPDKLSEVETWVVARMRNLYEPAAAFAYRNQIVAIGGGILLVAGSIIGIRSLGVEFLPHLEEGNMYIRASLPASISLEAGEPAARAIRRDIMQYPEVTSVLSAHGRPDDGTDATGFFNVEYFVPLKPFDDWPSGMTKEKLVAEMSKKLQDKYPGVDFSFSQIIEDNVEEAASGVKGANSVKLFGPDLATLETLAGQIRDQMAKVRGITDLGIFQSLGQPTVRIDVDRLKAARYGLSVDDVNQTVQAAIGGASPGDLYEPHTDRHFPIMVRLKSDQRDSLEAVRRITVGATAPDGSTIQVPLSELADIRLTSGASFIYREHQSRYIPIKFSVRDRDLGSAVAEAQRNIAQHVTLPPGYTLEWAGELANLQNAVARLEIVVPISLLLMLGLLYANFGNMRDTLLAFSVIPMAIVGGVLGLLLTGTAFSISAAIGFVALFGISVMDGILVVTNFNQAMDEGADPVSALRTATTNSLRPVVMTCLVAAIGLLPAALSSGIGSQVQKPLALVVVGGMTVAPILILLVLPLLINRFSSRLRPRKPDAAAQSHAIEGEPA
ncbi:CusA/CzcA family heavy metal efflux RND transporter [Novosphingobium sp. KCTC 2891]|uniref:efflux RND transporter permease subunit n=1 Tax=Novosphingobium sp. KCTC 2891 TaxID=2989730 RepID=UPI002221E4F5|nr:CusA/CzcA family heavy metal efflux RND transporter [Novosphingobium sp. KCTC 2891]MCW1381889.1 CusA/CzcA family heavy metal efflux RND transporter [Novosphingobium sp. KCTC 2891]